jgi:hypothetical protein
MADETTDVQPPEGEPLDYVWVLDCPCGERLRADSEETMVVAAKAHLTARHPDMADSYEREHILFMTTKFRR